MIKKLAIFFFAVNLSWQHDGHDDDCDDEHLIEAVGAGFPVFVSTYLNHDYMKPYLNRCDWPVCAWCAKVNGPGQWIGVTATRKV